MIECVGDIENARGVCYNVIVNNTEKRRLGRWNGVFMLDTFIFGKKDLFLPGADTELRIQRNKNRTVVMLGGNIVGNRRSETSGVCARVRRGGMCGFSSLAGCTPDAVEAVIRAAGANAAFLDEKLRRGKGALPTRERGLVETASEAADPEQKYYVDAVRAIDAYIVKKFPALASREVVAVNECIEKVIATSACSDGHTDMNRSYIYVTMTAQTGAGVTVDVMDMYGGLGDFEQHFGNIEAIYSRLDKLYESVMKKREGVYPEAGERTCILAGELSGMLAHEAVGHTVEADIVSGGSVAAHMMGKQVASELVTMVDFAHTVLGVPAPLPIYIDDEGVEAHDAVLIKDGILTGYMHDRASAERFGAEPCGNARAFEFSDEPLIRMRNTAILPGKSKLEELIESVDDGYLFCQTNNGQADTTGEFMFGVTMGYEIKRGRIGRAILDTTISGVAFEMLKTVDMVSDDIKWCSAGYCGKKQLIPVGLGGPALRCRVKVGGR